MSKELASLLYAMNGISILISLVGFFISLFVLEKSKHKTIFLIMFGGIVLLCVLFIELISKS